MKTAFLFAISLLLFASCSQLKKEQPVTEPEAIAFAKNIESSIKKKDYTAMNKVIDIDLFADEIIKIADVKQKSSFKEGIKQGWNENKLSTEIIKSLGTNGTYQFVKVYKKGDHQHVIFRLYGDGGLNYHDFDLVKYADKVTAKDIFIYITGENLSKTMSQVYITAMQEASTSGETAMSQYSKALIALRRYYSQKEYIAAKEEYDNLPESLRNEKVIQILYLQVASSIGGDVYQQALTHFEKSFGNDPSAQLALFDVYFLKGDYDKVLAVIDKIDAEVQDPFLNYYRGLVYIQKKEDGKAIQYLEKLYAAMPNFEDGALELLANYLIAGQYKEAEAVVVAYKHNTSFSQSRLSTIEAAYPENAKNITW